MLAGKYFCSSDSVFAKITLRVTACEHLFTVVILLFVSRRVFVQGLCGVEVNRSLLKRSTFDKINFLEKNT